MLYFNALSHASKASKFTTTLPPSPIHHFCYDPHPHHDIFFDIGYFMVIWTVDFTAVNFPPQLSCCIQQLLLQCNGKWQCVLETLFPSPLKKLLSPTPNGYSVHLCPSVCFGMQKWSRIFRSLLIVATNWDNEDRSYPQVMILSEEFANHFKRKEISSCLPWSNSLNAVISHVLLLTSVPANLNQLCHIKRLYSVTASWPIVKKPPSHTNLPFHLTRQTSHWICVTSKHPRQTSMLYVFSYKTALLCAPLFVCDLK